MNDKTDKDQQRNFKSSLKEFDTLLKICLVIGIVVISGFIIYHAFKPEPGFVTFGILNENQEAENYPTEASQSENISFYLTVENDLDRDFVFNVKVLKGDNNTILSSTGSNGTFAFMMNGSLKHKELWKSSKLNISFPQIGANQIIIAELWQDFESKPEEFFNILWLRLNITS